MSVVGDVLVDQVGPEEAYTALKTDPDTALIDVRTRAEWTFVGMPDLSETGRQVWPIEWAVYPEMAPNPAFLETLEAHVRRDGGRMPRRLFFICRSGARSLSAARLVAGEVARDSGLEACINVAEGFEGDLDAAGHRGRVNGWKMRGLPWRQS